MHSITRTILVTVAVAAAAVPLAGAHAERKVGQKPEARVETVVTVGSPLLERYNMVVTSAPRLRDDFEVGLGIQGKIVIPSQSAFKVARAKPLKACTVSEEAYIDHIVGPRGAACLFDNDMDGKFDKAAADLVLFTDKKLKVPVAYDMVDTPANDGSDYSRIVLTYLGAVGGTLKLSYREFSHDVARPAFTEELSFPVGENFPQTLTWRDTKITLLGLDNDGLRYRVEAAK